MHEVKTLAKPTMSSVVHDSHACQQQFAVSNKWYGQCWLIFRVQKSTVLKDNKTDRKQNCKMPDKSSFDADAGQTPVCAGLLASECVQNSAEALMPFKAQDNSTNSVLSPPQLL